MTSQHPVAPASGLTLAFDLDGVLADYTGEMRKVAGIGPDVPDPATYSMRGQDNPGWFESREDWLEAHITVTDRCDRLGLLDATAPATLRELARVGHQIVYLTARSPVGPVSAEKIDRDTRTWLREHGFPSPDALVLDGDKAGHHSAVGFDALLDDAPHNVAAVREVGGHAIIFDQTYNRHVSGARAMSTTSYAEQTAGDPEFRRTAHLARRLRANATHVYSSLDGRHWEGRPRTGTAGWERATLPPSAGRVRPAEV